MPPKSRKLLEDLRSAASDIAAYTRSRTLAEYLADKQFRWSIERGFEIIGEALSQLKKCDPALAAKIGEHRKIVSYRNVLIHGYSVVNDEKTWDIVQNDLPILRRDLDNLLTP
jgi:uncharacterized protein with HEPN domain